MENEKVVGTISNYKVYYDGLLYYITVNGENFVVDERKVEFK